MKRFILMTGLVATLFAACELAEVAGTSSDETTVSEQGVDQRQPPPHQVEVLPCDSKQPSEWSTDQDCP